MAKDVYMKKEESEAHHIDEDEDVTESQEEMNKFINEGEVEMEGEGASMEVDNKVQDAKVYEDTETLGDASELVKMDDEDPVDIEERDSLDSNKTMDEEEQVYETAKSLLLNCASPDSVLRLKYSEFGDQEKDKLQIMYFHQQSHKSLRDLLDNHLNKNDHDKNRFLEVMFTFVEVSQCTYSC